MGAMGSIPMAAIVALQPKDCLNAKVAEAVTISRGQQKPPFKADGASRLEKFERAPTPVDGSQQTICRHKPFTSAIKIASLRSYHHILSTSLTSLGHVEGANNPVTTEAGPVLYVQNIYAAKPSKPRFRVRTIKSLQDISDIFNRGDGGKLSDGGRPENYYAVEGESYPTSYTAARVWMGESAANNREARDKLLDAVVEKRTTLKAYNVIYAISLPTRGNVEAGVARGDFSGYIRILSSPY